MNHSVKTAQQIQKCLQEKNWTQKDLAIALNKTEAEISKWMSGQHNFTFKTIAKIENALNKQIITYNERDTFTSQGHGPVVKAGHLGFL